MVDQLEPFSDIGVQPGIDKGDRPVIDVAVDVFDFFSTLRPDKVADTVSS